MDGMDRIRELLGRITDLSDQELTELRDLVLQNFDSADAGAGDYPDAASLAVLRELADASEAVEAAITERNQVREDRAALSARRSAGITELAAETTTTTTTTVDGEGADAAAAGGTDDDPTAVGDGAGAGDGEGGDGVTAAGTLPPAVAPIEVPAGRRPQPVATATTVIASADVPGFALGQSFADSLEVATAMCRRIDSLRHVRGGDGEQVVVASAQITVPSERHLVPGEGEENYRKVMDVVKPKAIVAAGGVFAPLDTRYDLFGGGVTDRPVRDMLPSFTADRGGIRFVTSPTLAQLEGAVGVWTVQNDQDAALPDDPGATPPFVSPTKPVLRVAAGTEVTVNTQAVTVGLVFGNMQARAYPELVARHTDLAMVAHARIAEQQLLAQIGALSLHVTTPAQVIGAARHVLVQCDKAAAAYRNRYRTGALPLRAIFPAWFKDLLRADLAMQMPGDGIDVFSLAEATINNWFATRNINVTWALDGEAGQDYGVQGNNTALQDFPEDVIWYLFVEGTFLFLDGGTLDLGIVRDSTLNAKNDYQTFVETFEAVAKVGWESLRVTSAIDPLGTAAALVAVADGSV